MQRKCHIGAAVFALAWVPFHRVAHACAVCITGAASDRLTDAFNWSVLFLMAMPYAMLASVGGYLFYSYRRAAKQAGEATRKAPVFKLAWIHKESGR